MKTSPKKILIFSPTLSWLWTNYTSSTQVAETDGFLHWPVSIWGQSGLLLGVDASFLGSLPAWVPSCLLLLLLPGANGANKVARFEAGVRDAIRQWRQCNNATRGMDTHIHSQTHTHWTRKKKHHPCMYSAFYNTTKTHMRLTADWTATSLWPEVDVKAGQMEEQLTFIFTLPVAIIRGRGRGGGGGRGGRSCRGDTGVDTRLITDYCCRKTMQEFPYYSQGSTCYFPLSGSVRPAAFRHVERWRVIYSNISPRRTPVGG